MNEAVQIFSHAKLLPYTTMIMTLKIVCILFLFCAQSANGDGNAIEAEMFCPIKNSILTALGSRSPFFGDVLSPRCTNSYENYLSEENNTLTFEANEGINASCLEHQVITRMKLTLSETRQPSTLILECTSLSDPNVVDRVYTVSSEQYRDALVDCQEGVMQGISFAKARQWPITRVELRCVKLL
ncbi:hypothetical protein JTE90_020346 [Oedothorax gibbosus]|uniref:Uncharacterized protein n=1 Tax=Oedothorax gibbosus TaxID=931172 RepID=A0AAV6TYX6_9ARAC|nr:hypothetical protein JTE90_020346 [Oedothorax gibbosus]